MDYETYPAATRLDDLGRFHAQWRRVNPDAGWADPAIRWAERPRGDARRLGRRPTPPATRNYVILDAAGAGHYVGCHLDIDVFSRQVNDWYGEGDDMIFVDGEPWPGLHGTGTEDYFNTAFCPKQEYVRPITA